MPAARRELLRHGLVRRPDVEATAREHRVCPFELSLDGMAWADVVVGDYNYVFDPIVRLARLENAVFSKVGLIVDEAHQLGDRVRDMLGSTLERRSVRSALREEGIPAPIAKCLRSIDRALGAAAGGGEDAQREIAEPTALLRAIERLVAQATENPVEAERFPATAVAYFDALLFGRLSADAQAGNFHFIVRGAGRDLAVELVCTLPGDHIQETMGSYHGGARMSGSLTPAPMFQGIHGASDDGDVCVSDGCFPAQNFGVFLVTDVSTYYRDRERTLPRIAHLIEGVCNQTTGNYLVALPSFEYAQAVANAVSGLDVRCQRSGMALDEREVFIRWICEAGAGRVGFIVLGGVFGESVDFDGGVLDGVIVVGAGLPPRSLRRDLIARDSADAGLTGDGDGIAYRQPAMTRVVQAAGRVVRSATDRGIAVLVDPRFAQPAYRAFLPARWRTKRVRAASTPAEAGKFWFGDAPAAPPRTHAGNAAR